MRPLPSVMVSILVACTFGLVGAATASASPPVEPRIIGGVQATIEDSPWQVALLRSAESNPYLAQSCGGSIIAAEWIATAAHCVDTLTSPTQLQVAAGVATLPNSSTSSLVRYGVQRILIHPEWDSTTNYADVALLKLSSPLPLNGTTMAAIALPTFSSWPTSGTQALITGWGNSGSQTDPDWPATLRKADVSILSGPGDTSCGSYPPYPEELGYLAAVMLCAGTSTAPYIDTCQGDSGGPLAIRRDGQWYLGGITSFGRGCAAPGYPGVYARVTAFTDWMRSAQVAGATGSISVSATGPQLVDCVYVYRAGVDAGPIASRCAEPAASIVVPDVFPGSYTVRASFSGKYDADTWYATGGPALKRSGAASVKVTAARDTKVTTSTVAGTAMTFTFPTQALTARGWLYVDVYSTSVDTWTSGWLPIDAISLDVNSIPPSTDGYVVYVWDTANEYASYYYTGPGESGSLAYEEASVVQSPINATTTLAVTLTRAATIAGSVAMTPLYEPNGRVSLYVKGVEEAVGTFEVNADGTYSMAGLPPDAYEVEAWDIDGLHKPQWWNGSASRSGATSVTVNAGGGVTGINMRLQVAGVITGKVSGPGGSPLAADSDVSAVLWKDGAEVTRVAVEEDGTYRFTALDPGEYRVEARDAEGLYPSRWFSASKDLAGATPVSVAAMAITSGINIAVSPNQTIQITVKRTGSGARSSIVISGTSMGLTGSKVTSWVKVAGAKKFVAGTAGTIRTDGTFTLTYRTTKAASIYVQAGTVKSATVSVVAAR